MRDYATVLARWRGGRAKLWELTVSMKTLTIRIERAGVTGNLHVWCFLPKHIQGPVYWDDCDIEVVPLEDGKFIVRDVRAGLEIHAANVGAAENCEPVFTPPVTPGN